MTGKISFDPFSYRPHQLFITPNRSLSQKLDSSDSPLDPAESIEIFPTITIANGTDKFVTIPANVKIAKLSTFTQPPSLASSYDVLPPSTILELERLAARQSETDFPTHVVENSSFAVNEPLLEAASPTSHFPYTNPSVLLVYIQLLWIAILAWPISDVFLLSFWGLWSWTSMSYFDPGSLLSPFSLVSGTLLTVMFCHCMTVRPILCFFPFVIFFFRWTRKKWGGEGKCSVDAPLSHSNSRPQASLPFANFAFSWLKGFSLILCLVHLCTLHFPSPAVPLSSVSMVTPSSLPSPEPVRLHPDLQVLLDNHSLHSFWTPSELTFLSSVSWYEFLQAHPDAGTRSNVIKMANLLLKYRHLGDPVDFSSRPKGVMEEPDIMASMEIDTGDAAPIKSTPYPVSPKKRCIIETEVEKMLAKQVIRQCNSPWASPVVIVPKPDGTWRFCVSYVKLNQVTKKDSYPLHRPDAVAQLMRSMTIFTTCDLQSGFWQCRLGKEAQEKCAFVTHLGTHTFNVMPFGLANAPSTFQRMMDRVLAGLLYKNCFIFIDDVCVFSRTLDDHLDHLDAVLSRLDSNDLKIKLSKCFFFQSQIDYLGMEFSAKGCRPKLSNVTGVLDFAEPRNVKGVRSFLGMVGFYRFFIPGFAGIALPLNRLLRKDVDFYFGPEEQEAFLALKGELVKRPILHHPDFSLPFIVQADTSAFAIGSILAQEFLQPVQPLVQVILPQSALASFDGCATYGIHSVCMPDFVIPFWVHDSLFGSVLHYVSHVKAEVHGLHLLVDRLALLDVHSLSFLSELKSCMQLLEAALLTCPSYVPEGWLALIDVAFYEATMAKFYQQKEATTQLLRMAPNLKCGDQVVLPLPHSKVLRAVGGKLRHLSNTGTLDEDRPVYRRHPVGYYSATLTPAEQNYDARERECLGIIRSCEHFSPTISMCVQLILETDHQPLSYLSNVDHQGRLYRWNLRLQRFAPFTVVHLPGWLNGPPDGLSRYLTSRFDIKQLSETLYGSEEDLSPPPSSQLSELRPYVSTSTRIYDPIYGHPDSVLPWRGWGYSVIHSAELNFFAPSQRPCPSTYDVVISAGPFADLGITVEILETMGTPWALLVPTRAITNPRFGLQNVTDLKILALSGNTVYTQRSKRSVPIHRAWVTSRFSLLKSESTLELQFQVVSTEDCYVYSDLHRPPPDMSVAIPFSSNKVEEIRVHPDLFVSTVTTRSLQRLNSPAVSSAPSSSPKLVNPSEVGTEAVRAERVSARKKVRHARRPRSRDTILYEVEKTLAHRTSPTGGDDREFLIQWKSGPNGESYEPSWQPETGLSVGTLSAYWDRLLTESGEAPNLPPPVSHSKFVLPDSRRVDAHLPLPRDNLRDEVQTADDATSSRQRPVEEEHPTFQRVHHDQFRFAQEREPELAAYLALSKTLDGNKSSASNNDLPDDSDSLPLVFRYKRTYLLLRSGIPPDVHWVLREETLDSAIVFATRLLDESSHYIFPASRFAIKTLSVGSCLYHFRELSVSRSEVATFSTNLNQPFRWVYPKAALLLPLQGPALLLFHAVRDNLVSCFKREFPPTLIVKDGVLFHLDPYSSVARVVVPKALRVKLMYIAHDLPTSGHRGPSATFKELSRRYWWKGMRAEVHYYCKGCLKCNKGKAVGRSRYGYLQMYALVPPGHTLHIDYYGPFTPTPRGNTIVLTVIDRCTGYVWAFAAKDSTALTLATTLYDEWFMEYFLPVNIVSDNGPAFVSEIYRELCTLFYVKALFVTAYHPESNSKIERVHKDFKPALKAYVAASGRDWDLLLKPIVLAKRTALIDNSVYSPYHLWHNRAPVTVLDLLSGHWDFEPQKFPFLQSQLDSQALAMKVIANITRIRVARNKLIHDSKAKPAPDWSPGQLVLVQRDVKQKGISQKLVYQWVGPVCITRRVSPVVYEVMIGVNRHDTSGGNLLKYHVHRLHPFYPSSHPRTEKLLHIDLFNFDSDLNNLPVEDVVIPYPTLGLVPGRMVLAVIDGILRVCRVLSNESRTSTVDLHLYDTVGMGTERDDVARWDKAWFPLFLNEQNGIVVQKDSPNPLFLPLDVSVSHHNVVGIPFELGSSQTLKTPQRRCARDWLEKSSPPFIENS